MFRPSYHPHKTYFWQFCLETSTPVASWSTFCSALPVLLLFLFKQRSSYRSCCWVVAAMALSSYLASLPVSSPCYWNWWHPKAPCDDTYGCAIIKELDYLCNVTGLLVLLMLQAETYNNRSNLGCLNGLILLRFNWLDGISSVMIKCSLNFLAVYL